MLFLSCIPVFFNERFFLCLDFTIFKNMQRKKNKKLVQQRRVFPCLIFIHVFSSFVILSSNLKITSYLLMHNVQFVCNEH